MSLFAFILGAGGGVGHSVAAKLIAEGYKVAAASRNPNLSAAKEIGFHPIKLDLADPEQVPKAFAEVEKALGGFPNVVVYNAYAATFPSDLNILSGIPTENFRKELNVNTVSLWATAQAAVAGWEKLEAAVPKTLIFTGNVIPWVSLPKLVSLGTGKAASAHIISSLATAYEGKGFRFYFTLQLLEDGGIYYGIDGPVTATVYWDLIKRSEQGSWKVAFDKNGRYLTDKV